MQQWALQESCSPSSWLHGQGGKLPVKHVRQRQEGEVYIAVIQLHLVRLQKVGQRQCRRHHGAVRQQDALSGTGTVQESARGRAQNRSRLAGGVGWVPMQGELQQAIPADLLQLRAVTLSE